MIRVQHPALGDMPLIWREQFFCRYFSKYATSEVKKRELLSGAAAAGDANDPLPPNGTKFASMNGTYSHP
jgi:hypothetical protein